ncbi:hypothetical protein KSS87_020957, partial [Heliosperma pusillum]
NHEIVPHLGTPQRNHIVFPPLKVKLRTTEKPWTGLTIEPKKQKLDLSNPLSETVVGNTQKQAASEPVRLIDKPRHGKFICENKPSAIKLDSANKWHEKRDASHSAVPLTKKQGLSIHVVDTETERRITTLIEKVNSSFNVDEVLKQKNATSMYKSSNNMIDKYMTKGKVEGAVRAVRNALKKLDDGGSIDDAKLICSTDMLNQVPIWKIVDRLQNYVLDGDMIVDFCCGSNEFSCLMKEKLDTEGKKKCSFKNYDLFPTRNDFNFERKNWFDVGPEDLPEGSQLVMGLNPPFGYKASLANKLDRRKNRHLRYDLLWEDQNLLTGESFYLPGAFSAEDRQISQWNNVPPPLYLWSHPDWTRKHREIANRCGHSVSRDKLPVRRPPSPKHLPEEQQDAHRDFIPNTQLVDDIPGPMNAENMVVGNIYGHDKSNVYGHSMSNVYGHPTSNFYSPPASNVYGPPMSNVYGQSNVYSPIYSPIYSSSMSNVYGPPMSNVYSHSGPRLDIYRNTPSVEDKYIDIPSIANPGLRDVEGQRGGNSSGRENVADLHGDNDLKDMEISPTNTNPRRNLS